MDYTGASAFQAHTTFYEPDSQVTIGGRSQIDWTGNLNMGSYSFQANDYISLRYADSASYPAIDCIITAAMAMPYYFSSGGFRWTFGVQEGIL